MREKEFSSGIGKRAYLFKYLKYPTYACYHNKNFQWTIDLIKKLTSLRINRFNVSLRLL